MVIKYRCWDKDVKKWRKPNVKKMVSLFTPEGNAMRIVPPEGYEFMLWTGFTDRNGNDIYPGDILNDQYFVRWDVLEGAWGLYGPISSSGATHRFNTFLPQEANITGNIYENPDWLHYDPDGNGEMLHEKEPKETDE